MERTVLKLLLLHLLTLLPSSIARPHSEHAHLDVAAMLSGDVPARGRASAQTEPWTLTLLHRDRLPITGNGTAASYESRLHEKLRRDAVRVAWIRSVVHGVLQKEADFGSPVISGLLAGSGEYFARIGVGTPSREQYMVLDTGSDVVWLQCQPCRRCYSQADPIFDPVSSASFSAVGCGSAVCSQLDSGGGCRSGGCVYEVAYGDGSYTLGSFATETLTFGSTVVRNVAIGCGHDNSGLFVGAGGLLGLGAGALSFPSQLGTQTGGTFSFCLVDRQSESPGTLAFGPGSVPAGAVFAPMSVNRELPSFYYVSLVGVLVGGQIVEFPALGDGVIVDSGTAVTRLDASVYASARDAFLAGTGNLRRVVGKYSIFDACYDLSGMVSARVPTVGLFFANGATVMLPPENYMINVDNKGTFCFAFAPAQSGPSIIGNTQLQHIRVSFDTVNSLIGFAVNQC